MSLIKILPDNISNKIAAGEVIERPASVVKELVENSIDAGATKIEVIIEKAGRKLIRVIDNGAGMDPDDAVLCVEPHATSKISSEKDINCITTMGFRGEAIPSIASVSKLIINTKRKELSEGREVVVNGGRFVKEAPSGCAPGTDVSVSNIFFNIPARKKFLKADSTEEKHINETVCMLALANYEVSFSLVIDGRTVFVSPGNREMLSRLSDYYGKSILKHLLKIDSTEGNIRVFGYVSKPGYVKTSRREQRIFINRRPIRNNIIYGAIRDAYDTLIMKDSYPVSVLFIDLPADMVDINVHPAKHEARFKNSGIIRRIVANAIETSVRKHLRPAESVKHNRVPFTSILKNANINYQTKNNYEVETLFKNEELDTSESLEVNSHKTSLPSIDKQELSTATIYVRKTESIVSEQNISIPGCDNLKVLGNIDDTYIICSGSDSGVIIIDQHAAHERVMFEKLMHTANIENISQKLLIPINLELSVLEYNFVLKNGSKFYDIGFDVQDFGQNTVLISSIPVCFKINDIKGLFSDLLEELISEKQHRQTVTEEAIATAACKLAVKAHDRMEKIEAEALLRSLSKCKIPYTCPHGRPTIINIPLSELEKRFGRRN